MTALNPLRRQSLRLAPDATRVIAKMFVPDEELPGRHSRAGGVVERVLQMSDAEVEETLADLRSRFTRRHRDLDRIFSRHFDQMAPRIATARTASPNHQLLIGAYFTAEYATEGAALTNPSMVEHPNQDGLGPGELRFLMSARAIGEGHISCIAFRTGVIDPDGGVRVDTPGPFLDSGQIVPRTFTQRMFWAQLEQSDADDETAGFVLDRLGETFDRAALDAVITGIDPRLLRRRSARETIQRLEWVAYNNYAVTFPTESKIDERLLAPVGPTESHGMEDARFTRLVEADGKVTYCATYTAYDRVNVLPQLIQTHDFVTFSISQLNGPAAKNKGMAVFPRQVGGQYLSLSRYDRERSSITRSDDCLQWQEAMTLNTPLRPWELIQAGNCGPPIETAEGWLVLTHGVGPMRTYGLGALLLDLEDPAKVLASTPRPLLLANEAERDGYVPNVVYSCGGMRHRDHIVLPYGYGDQRIAFAILDLPLLLDQLRATG